MKIISRLFFSLIALSAISVNAALYNRGGGMIYDSTLNITWLQDANYAKTSGDYNGRMGWQEATDWAANLVYGGYSDWRLPSAGLNGTNNVCSSSYSSCPGYYNGTYDRSYNNNRSEIGHLFFELGNKARYNTTGQIQSAYGVTDTTFVDLGTGQSVSFLNLQNDTYWEAETYAPDLAQSWVFVTNNGFNGRHYKSEENYAWAVRDGDVSAPSAVPVPAAAWLMSSGLIGLAGIARRKK